MSIINISNLTFAYDGSNDYLFKDVSFTIDSDWKLGFIGRNGRGKTTFLNLLMGKYEYSGTITSSVEFDYFPFAVPDKSLNTIDIVEKIYPEYEYWRLSKEISLLELSDDMLYRPFSSLSNGEQTKLLLAALFIKENNFLLIDEPTNHLDAASRITINNYLKKKKGFILVSHDRLFLDISIDHVLSINKANIEIQKGNFSSWQKNRELQDSNEISKNENLGKEIKRLGQASGRTASWSMEVEKTKIGSKMDKGFIGHKAAKMMKRAKSTAARQEKAVEEKKGLLKNIERSDDLFIKMLDHHSERYVEFKNVSTNYEEKAVFKNLNFILNDGDRIALKGKNGCGKSTVLKLIMGEPVSYTGDIYIAGNLIISNVPQDSSFLKGNLSNYASENKIEESLFKTLLSKLGFSSYQFETEMQDFSEGEKKKVLIAASLSKPAHLYLWDEPLNFIDVISRVQIQNLILEYKPTMLFVEHDAVFTEEIATGIVEFNPD